MKTKKIIENGIEYTVHTYKGFQEWWFNDYLHREMGPAIIYPNGDQEWFFEGKYHRIGGSAITKHNKMECWCINGQYHRLDGPAIRYNGTQLWYFNDKKILVNSQEEFEQWIKLRAFT